MPRSIAKLTSQLAAMEDADDRTSGGISDQALDLRDQIATMRPETMADAAAMIAHAATALWELPILLKMPEAAAHQIQRLEQQLLAALPILVAAAGGSMDAPEFAEARKRSAALFSNS